MDSPPTISTARYRWSLLSWRLVSVARYVPVRFAVVYLLGLLLGAPQWLPDLEPFARIRWVGVGDFTAVPLALLPMIGATLIGLGTAAFRRRDLQT